MKITEAYGVTGLLLNPYHNGGKWVFRVYSDKQDGTFVDYDLCHSDLCVTIKDADAAFIEDGGVTTLGHMLY